MKTFVLLLAVLVVPAAHAEAPPLVMDALQVEQMPPIQTTGTATTTPAPSFLDQVKGYATPANVEWALGTLLGIAAVAKFATERRKRIVALIVKNAFYATEDAASETTDPNFNKLAAALKSADAWCLAHGWRTLTPGEQALATLQLQAQHGEEIAKAKVAAAAPAAVQS